MLSGSVSLIGFSAVDHVQFVAFDGLPVFVDIAPKGTFRRHRDDLHTPALHPVNRAYALQKVEDGRHIVGSDAGQVAVAHVIMNRVADERWGDNPAEVSLQLKQFSAWNNGVGGNSLPTNLEEGSAEYEWIGRIVDGVAAGQIPDVTGGATHYYSPKGMEAHVAAGEQSNVVPTWLGRESQARGHQNVQIGGHIFTGLRRESE